MKGVHHHDAVELIQSQYDRVYIGSRVPIRDGFYNQTIKVYDINLYEIHMKMPEMKNFPEKWGWSEKTSTFFPEGWNDDTMGNNGDMWETMGT